MFLDEIHVTFYIDTAAAILSLGVFVLCGRGIIKDEPLSKLFRSLSIVCFCLSLLDAATYARKNHEFPGALPIALGLQTLLELTLNFVIILWMVFVNYRIYHSRDVIKRDFVKYLIPLVILMGIDIINVFTGIIFYYDEHVMYHTTAFTIYYYVVRYAYLFGGAIQIAVSKKSHRDLKFFDVWGFIIPSLAGGLINSFTDYSGMCLGFAIGLCLVYAGIINELSFMDHQTGYYNRYYLRYLKRDIDSETFSPKSGIIYRLMDPDDMKAFAGLLSPILPKKCEVVRYNEDTVVMLAEISKRGALHMMSEDVESAVEQYNRDNQDKTMSVTMDEVYKKKKETSKGFYEMFIRRIG